jgi:anti-sigma factor ChrR (cupin superfamily)
LSTNHDTERLMELVLGALGPSEREEVDAHVAACPDCARFHAELTATLGELPLALPRRAPPASLRARLAGSLDHLERFSRFAPRLGEILGLAADDARRALHVFERPERMKPTPRPGMRIEHVAAGAARPGVTAMLASFDPGAVVARHRHDQEERIFVFQGMFECDDGAVVRAGEEIVSPVGTAHENYVGKDEACFCVIVKTARAAPA